MHIHTRISLCLNLYLHTYLSICMSIYLSIYLHTHTYRGICVCVCVCVRACQHANPTTSEDRLLAPLAAEQRHAGACPSAMLVHCMHTCLIAQSCAACRWTELGIQQRQEVACLSAQPGMASSSEAPKPEEAFGFAVSRVLQLQQRTRTHQHSCLRFRGARPSTRNRRRYPNPAKHSRATKCRAVAVGS